MVLVLASQLFSLYNVLIAVEEKPKLENINLMPHVFLREEKILYNLIFHFFACGDCLNEAPRTINRKCPVLD